MRLIFVLLVLIVSLQSSAQNSISYDLTVREGLIDNSVYTTTQDKRGFMWFGTWKGLCSYDTRGFKTYKNDPKNPRSISSDFIRSSFLDSKGILWIGTNWGLNRYDPLTDSFDRFFKNTSNENSLGDNTIWCLMEDRKGNLWMGTSNGISRLSTRKGTVSIKRFLYSKDLSKKKWDITSIYIAPDGFVWAVGSNELIGIDPDRDEPIYRSMTRDKASNQKKLDILAIYGDTSGNIWVGSRDSGIGKFDRKTKQFLSFRSVPMVNGEKMDFLMVDKISASVKGDLWLRTNQGLLNFDPLAGKFKNQAPGPIQDNRSTDQGILDLYVDNKDGLWVGTFADGVKYITPHSNFFVRVPASIGEIAMQQVLQDGNGGLWFQAYGSDRFGNKNSIWFRSNKGHTLLNPGPVTGGESTRSYFDGSGNLWVGLVKNILIKYKVVAGKLVEQNRYVLPVTNMHARDWITAIAEDKKGLVVGTYYNGLYCFDSVKDRFIAYQSGSGIVKWADDKHISFLLKDSRDNLWIGSSFGISIVDSTKSKIIRFQTANKIQESATTRTVNSIHQDNEGRIWIILSNDGLYLYDSVNHKLIPKNQSKDISGHNITNLQHDNNGNLWLSNELGLVEFNTKKSTTRQYFYNEGIPGSRIMSNSAIMAKDGAIFVTTNSGAFYFYPDQIPFNRQPPAVVFTDLRLFNKPVTVDDETGLLKTKLSESDAISFHHDQSIFSVDFAVLNFTHPEKNRYAYKLDGFEKDWNYVKTPTASYTNLPAGTYTLLIK
ncbi:two-component regulator propeller domain-containing protein, partial [Dyadobacter sp. CY312]|uniref:two-component regulator propeller domain-containing protein n=1 Tax=Dyadobacter sp. CY312 TaxID=2907303 RepID=UPI001F340AC3